MCGIVGIAGKIGYNERQAFKDMLLICQVRGRDSTGAIKVEPNDGYKWHKRAVASDVFIDTKEYDKNIDSGTAKVLIGHCRAKTVGNVSSRNAHPFEFDNVIGVHNGTLKWTHGLERFRDFEVDSEWMYWHINEYGIDQTISVVDPEGAWMLNWWNSETKTLNFLRNNHRPLWLTHSQDRETMVWASESWMLNLFARKIQVWDGGDTGQVFYPLPENMLWSVTVDNNKKGAGIFTMQQPRELKAEVRRYMGNANTNVVVIPPNQTGNGDSESGTKGGEVVRPFRGPVSEQIKRQKLAENALNDALPPSLLADRRLASPALNQAGSQTTTTSAGRPSNGSQNTSGTQTGSRNSPNSGRGTLSLQSRTSKGTEQTHNGKICVSLVEQSAPWLPSQTDERKVSVRQVAGMSFVTDHKTKREFSELAIDAETTGKCTFCQQPIGGLEDIHELFVQNPNTIEEDIRLLGNCCTKPVIRI